MQILADRGQSTAALGVYEALRRRLSHDLGVKPEPATLAAYEAIRRRRDGADGPADGSAMDAAATVEAAQPAASEAAPADAAGMPSVAVLPFEIGRAHV